ncbi:MAG TPA: LptA/OstA family protein [Steroidobacteraceae bacterium]|nr:LptA/OstA family protein [Steroidobacteraceae bacterium]
MAASIPNRRSRAAALLAALSSAVLTIVAPCTTVSAAELVRPGDEYSYSADVLSSDFRSDTLDLSGNVRVVQGPNSIEASAATAKNFRSENSRWVFEKSVHIVTTEADLQSSSARADIVGGRLTQARVEGSPAQFEQRGGRVDRPRGRAGVIEYDFVAGVVKLTDQVWFSNGKDEFRGDEVIYSVRDERVQTSGRVRGIIRPRQGSETIAPAPPAPQPEGGA